MIPNGTDCKINPAFPVNPLHKRFQVRVREHDPNEEPGWKYQLNVYDNKYLDCDGYVIYSIAGGDSWDEAYAHAFNIIEQAVAKPEECIFV